MPITRRLSAVIGIATSAALALGLAGCSAPTTADDRIRIVASTNVYGDLAATVGGSAVQVTSIIRDPNRDPHDYQADARTQLALSKAAIVVENGTGYDEFVRTMLKAAGTHPVVVSAMGVSGHREATLNFNEHLWYEYPTVVSLVSALVDALSTADPTHQADFESRGGALIEKIKSLEGLEEKLAGTYRGTGVATTEPVADYVLSAIGLLDTTPFGFSRAIEDGMDAAPEDVAQTLAAIRDHRAAALIYNVQTAGSQTDAVIAAAKQADVPAVPVSETLPPGLHYVDWQAGFLAELTTALAG